MEEAKSQISNHYLPTRESFCSHRVFDLESGCDYLKTFAHQTHGPSSNSEKETKCNDGLGLGNKSQPIFSIQHPSFSDVCQDSCFHEPTPGTPRQINVADGIARGRHYFSFRGLCG